MHQIDENFALELLRKGRSLMRMHTARGVRWFIVPGGAISDDTAEKILARPDVQPANDGLFPGISQTFRLRSVLDAIAGSGQ